VSPRLKFAVISISALAGVLVTLSLGRWQLDRAAQKEQLFASIEAQSLRTVLEPADLLDVTNFEPLIHRTVRLRGHWLPAKTIFLDNRQMNAKPGLYVMTPLLLEGGRAVLVQRGWVARNFVDRTQVPDVPTPIESVELVGRIAPPPSKLYELGDAGSGPIRQNLDLTQFGLETGLGLLPVSVRQTGDASDGLGRDWPVANTGVDKHYGYAFQWFGLSALIAILYVWFQIVRRLIKQRQH
jgi:surfeit locus 1 family protein